MRGVSCSIVSVMSELDPILVEERKKSLRGASDKMVSEMSMMNDGECGGCVRFCANVVVIVMYKISIGVCRSSFGCRKIP